MISLSEIPQSLTNIINSKTPLYYDISDQVIQAYGHEVIIKDLQKLQPIPCEGRWSGGELIMGTPEFFSSLCEKIDDIYEIYTEIYEDLQHNGDEIITSAALELLRKEGIYIAEAGTIGIIGRFWSIPVLHPQKPFDYYEKLFLLHLPADKIFLAKISDSEIVDNRNTFIKEYKKYLQFTKPRRWIRIFKYGINILKSRVSYHR